MGALLVGAERLGVRSPWSVITTSLRRRLTAVHVVVPGDDESLILMIGEDHVGDIHGCLSVHAADDRWWVRYDPNGDERAST